MSIFSKDLGRWGLSTPTDTVSSKSVEKLFKFLRNVSPAEVTIWELINICAFRHLLNKLPSPHLPKQGDLVQNSYPTF